MYSTRSNLILGFHGCEKSEQQKLISDSSYVRISDESFDWLGHGMYFWENNPERAMLWAKQKKKAGTLKEPSFDSVRAAFIEGDTIYPGAGFNEKTHIQICIINPDCIKGFFLPRKKSSNKSLRSFYY